MLLAIALSIVIMVVWQKFLMPEQPRERQPTEQTSEQPLDVAPYVSTPGEPLAMQPIPVLEPVALPDELTFEEPAERAEVLVETARMAASFSTAGGRLTSLKLTEFKSKRGDDGDKVEIIPQNGEIIPAGGETQGPLALIFNDPNFGVPENEIIYHHKVYGPSDLILNKLAASLRACEGQVFPTAAPDQIGRQIDACLPRTEEDGDLRALTIAVAAEGVAATKSADSLIGLAQLLESGKLVVFSRQLTTRLRLIKAFAFPADGYSFDMHVVIRNTGDETLDLGHGRPSYSVSWAPGMETSERVVKYDQIQAVSLVERNFEQKALKKFKEAKEYPETLEWVGLKRKYFFLLLEPMGELVSARIETKDVDNENIQIVLNMAPLKLEPGASAAHTIRIHSGPMLGEVLESLGPGFGQLVNFGFFDFFGKILLAGLLWFNKYVQNYGLAIILLTVVVRVGLFPLNQKSYKSMKEMQALQPKMTELREKYKKNPQEMNKKTMELYRTHKVNPLGGCLPMLAQMPIFIALFQALRNAVELRGAHFLWMTDLSEPDRFFMITSPVEFPVNLLPLFVIVAMLVQQKMTPMAAGGQNEAQQKMMQYMPIIFGFIFYNMPSGLNVYFLVTTVLGLVQQYFVQKTA